jgi:glycosyltransferase involved in cell wall biosynthesis
MLSVILVNWNGRKWLKDCLDSLAAQAFRDFEIILVDNASTDGSAAYVKEFYPRVQLIESPENLGFGRGNNLGARAAKGDVLFLLNNDTSFGPELLGSLLEFRKRTGLNICGPRILDYDGNDIYQGRQVTIDATGCIGWGHATFYIEGSALLIGREEFFGLGAFDEAYFMYSEDIDLCWRAHLAGMRVGICAEATMKHFCGGSSDKSVIGIGGDAGTKKRHVVPVFRRYEVEKNNLRNILKNYQLPNLIWVVPIFLLQDFAESMLYLFTGNWRMFGLIWKAIYWNAANFESTLEARRAVSLIRRRGDWSVLRLMTPFPNKLRLLFAVGLPKFK